MQGSGCCLKPNTEVPGNLPVASHQDIGIVGSRGKGKDSCSHFSLMRGIKWRSFIAVGAKCAQLVPCKWMFCNEIRKALFSRDTWKKTSFWAGVMLPAARIRCSLQRSRTNFVEHIHTYLISCTFWNAKTLRSLFLQLAQSLMLALGQSHCVTAPAVLQGLMYSQALQLPEIHFWVLWKAPVGIFWGEVSLSKASGRDFPPPRHHHTWWLFSESSLELWSAWVLELIFSAQLKLVADLSMAKICLYLMAGSKVDPMIFPGDRSPDYTGIHLFQSPPELALATTGPSRGWAIISCLTKISIPLLPALLHQCKPSINHHHKWPNLPGLHLRWNRGMGSELCDRFGTLNLCPPLLWNIPLALVSALLLGSVSLWAAIPTWPHVVI